MRSRLWRKLVVLCSNQMLQVIKTSSTIFKPSAHQFIQLKEFFGAQTSKSFLTFFLVSPFVLFNHVYFILFISKVSSWNFCFKSHQIKTKFLFIFHFLTFHKMLNPIKFSSEKLLRSFLTSINKTSKNSQKVVIISSHLHRIEI